MAVVSMGWRLLVGGAVGYQLPLDEATGIVAQPPSDGRV